MTETGIAFILFLYHHACSLKAQDEGWHHFLHTFQCPCRWHQQAQVQEFELRIRLSQQEVLTARALRLSFPVFEDVPSLKHLETCVRRNPSRTRSYREWKNPKGSPEEEKNSDKNQSVNYWNLDLIRLQRAKPCGPSDGDEREQERMYRRRTRVGHENASCVPKLFFF